MHSKRLDEQITTSTTSGIEVQDHMRVFFASFFSLHAVDRIEIYKVELVFYGIIGPER